MNYERCSGRQNLVSNVSREIVIGRSGKYGWFSSSQNPNRLKMSRISSSCVNMLHSIHLVGSYMYSYPLVTTLEHFTNCAQYQRRHTCQSFLAWIVLYGMICFLKLNNISTTEGVNTYSLVRYVHVVAFFRLQLNGLPKKL